MGDYTSLHFEAKLSPVGVRLIEKLNAEKMRLCTEGTGMALVSGNHRRAWDTVVHDIMILATAHGGDANEIYAFSLQCPRRDNIPFMANGEDGWHNDLEDGTWKVACATKNANNEITLFLTRVLPWLLAETCIAFSQFEADIKETKWAVEPMIRQPSPQITQHRLES